MDSESPLNGKIVLLVDDEPDILETVAEQLQMCIIHKATNYERARQYLQSYTYDIVVLDIMGVNGFDLLKISVAKGFPTVMLTAHALSPETLKKSAKLGALFLLPKDKVTELKPILEEIVVTGGQSLWQRLLHKFGEFFDHHFEPDWKEKDQFLKEFMDELMA
jgi:DNA-binding NtrC family response regulator